MSKIHFLPVRYGDSFVIECDKGENHGVVVVDGGPSGGSGVLMDKLDEVGTPDLLVLSHYDDDHINGLHKYMETCWKRNALSAREIWANCAGNVKKRDEIDEEAGFDRPTTRSLFQGVKFSRLLDAVAKSDDVVWREDLVEGIEKEFPFASIEVVSPTEEFREKALNEMDVMAVDVDWEVPAQSAMKKAKALRVIEDIDKPLETLAKDSPKAPNTNVAAQLANASSIAFILRCDGLSVLMLGDCYPHNVIAYLRSKGYSEDNPLMVDYVKVAHHGSKHNTSNELLDIIKCNHFIISTNGEKFKHPDRQSIAHILCHEKRDRTETVHLYFNCSVKEIVDNGKRFVNDDEPEAWNFEIHENTTELEGLGTGDIVPMPTVPKEAPATAMTFTEVLQRRYSCRSFAAQAIEQEKIDRILEAGRIAPTAVNKQPVHIWAITNPDTLEAVKGLTRSNYGAPLILAVGCRTSDAWVRSYDKKNGAEVDASIVATYLMLAAENEGLATLWVGSFDPSLLKKLLPGTKGYKMVAMINVGYPSPESQPSAMHGVRKALEEFVTKID